MSFNVINPYQTFYDSNGKVRSSGWVTFYINTTTTPGAIYSDDELTVPQVNPYQLDAHGRITGDVKYTGLMTLKITNEDLSDVITEDNVSTINSAAASAVTIEDVDGMYSGSDVESVFAEVNSSVDSIADLRLIAPTAVVGNKKTILVRSYYTPNLSLANPFDGGGGSFAWDSTSTEADDNGAVIKATAAATGRWIRIDQGDINIRWFGAKGGGVVDDTTAITEAKVVAETLYRDTFFPPVDGGYLITVGFSLDVSKTTLKGKGTKVKFTPSGTDTLLEILNGESDANQKGLLAAANAVDGIEFIGPGKAVSGVRFATIDDATATNSIWGTTFKDGGIFGFAEGVYQGEGAFMTNFYNFHHLNNGWAHKVANVAVPSAERTLFWGCTFANNDEVLIHAKGASTFFIGCSLDFSPRFMTITNGHVFITGGHIENNSDTDYWFHVSGANASLSISQNLFVSSQATDKTFEPFYSDSTCVMGGITLTDMSLWTDPGSALQLIGGTGRSKASNITYLEAGKKTPIGDSSNITSYGGFESADFVNDFAVEGAVLPVQDNSKSHSGSNSLIFEKGTSGAAAKTKLEIDCAPGEFIVGNFWYQTTINIEGATFLMSVDYLDKAGTSILGSSDLIETADQATWLKHELGLQVRAPKGTYSALITWSLFGTTSGTAFAWIDDVIINKV
jgi:hypothetical protein